MMRRKGFKTFLLLRTCLAFKKSSSNFTFKAIMREDIRFNKDFTLGGFSVRLLSSSEKELVSFFKEQVKLEESIVKSINQALETITNPVVKGVLKGISLDSLKHAEIYKAAIEVASVAPALSQEEFDRLKEVVKRHVEDEERVIERVENAAEKTKNEKVKFLLESIALDENRHHELLKKIMDIVVRGETITEADWWEFLWRNVPFHGAPGG